MHSRSLPAHAARLCEARRPEFQAALVKDPNANESAALRADTLVELSRIENDSVETIGEGLSSTLMSFVGRGFFGRSSVSQTGSENSPRKLHKINGRISRAGRSENIPSLTINCG